MANKTIYRLNDVISFRKCSLFDGDELTFGDCTNFSTAERNWRTYIFPVIIRSTNKNR